MEFSIIVLSYNNLNATKSCIESITPYLNDVVELIVVDDGSTDGTPTYLKQFADKYSNFRTEINLHNTGTASSRNLGMAKAKGKWLLFLDNDTRFVGDVYSVMRQKAEMSGAGVVGLCGIVTNNDFSNYIHIHHNQMPTDMVVSAVPSYCMMVKHDTVLREGIKFNENLNPFAGEDVDFCINMKSKGIKILTASHVPLTHSEHGSGLIHDPRYLYWMEKHHMLIKQYWEGVYLSENDHDLEAIRNFVSSGKIELTLRVGNINFYDYHKLNADIT